MSLEGREADRERMVVEQLQRRGIWDTRVLDAVRHVPRHEFVPSEGGAGAYRDSPLPIGEGQSISQPYIVGLMTQMLDLGPEHRVLEIGTGSGYQTAVLAEIASEVFTIEVRASLLATARGRLERRGYSNIHFLLRDGATGWPERAPYDRVIVTACARKLPPQLRRQLSVGGVMVLPVARGETEQILCRGTLREGFGMDIEEGVPVRFVPMTSTREVEGNYED